MASEKVELQFIADTSKAQQGIEQIDKSLDGIGKSAQQATGTFDKMTSFISSRFVITAGDIARLGTVIGSAIGGALSALPGLISQGSGLDDLAGSFDSLATKAGVVSDAFLNDLSKSLGDTIPKVDLMKRANELLLGGLNPKQIDLVAKAARTFGEVTGTNAVEGMNAFGDSLLRGNDKALKTLGIVLDNEGAIQEYATSVGKATDQLTEAEKVEAIRNESLKLLALNTERLGEVTEDSGDVIDQISAAITDQTNEAIKAIGTNQDLQAALVSVRDVVREIDFGPFIAGLTNVISFAANAASAVNNFVNSTSLIDRAVAKTTGEYKVLDDQLGKVVETLSIGTPEAFKKAAIQYDDLVKVINETNVDPSVGAALADDMGFVKAQIESVTKSTVILSKNELPKLETVTRRAAKATKEQGDAAKETAAFIEKYKDAMAKQRDELAQVVQKSTDYETILKKLSSGELSAEVAGVKLSDLYKRKKGAIDELKIATEIYNGLLLKLSTGSNVAATDLAKAAQAVQDLKKEVDAASSDTGGQSLFGQLFDFSGNDTAQADIATSIGNALTSGISDAIKSGDVEGAIKNAGSSLGTALGAAAGASLGPIGAAIGGELGGALADKVIKDLSQFGKSGKGTGKGIKLAVDLVFPGLGTLGDKLFGDRLFGEAASTTARKQADKFFADAFDANRLSVIINGQLKQITDLDFGGGLFGELESKAGQFFSTLSGDSQGAFNAVAQGFASTLGLGTEAALGLAQVFSVDLGGSLNNLQLLVEATGLSFEQMSEQVVNAFLDGELSALQAQTALQGIQKVAEKGIPDGIGLVREAFDNIAAAGVKGGRTLIDALQDVGFEAKELGDKTLGQVITRLKNTAGVSADEVDKVFNALSKAGIKTLDDLTSATADQLIPALADLENQKFPFKQAADDARDYLDAIDKIPEKKDVQLNLRINYPNAADQKVVQDLAGRGQLGQGVATR